MALLRHLTSSASPLPDMREYTPPQTTYFSILGKYFLMWKFTTAARMYNTFFAISLFLIVALSPTRRIGVYGAALLGIFGGLVGAIVSVNIVALLMTRVLGKAMSWFSIESSALALYGGPAIVGTQYYHAPPPFPWLKYLRRISLRSIPRREHCTTE
jgi:hypothetical protein